MSLEEKKKAEIKFEESGMSKNLIKFSNKAKHYHAWVKNSKDFEKLHNFGLQDIRTEEVDIDVNYNTKIKYLTVANYKNIKIKFGNEFYAESYPGGGGIYEDVLFYIEDKLIVHAKYLGNDEEYGTLVRFYSLEEFHYTIEFEKMLSEMSKDIDDLAIKNKKLDKLKEEEKYKNKFSFDD